MSYCTDCGNTGITVDGKRCKCGRLGSTLDETLVCLTIPEEYRGLAFNTSLVDNDCGDSYPKFLQGVYDDIIYNNVMEHKNLFIGAPPKHSKTVLAYACIQSLFKRGIATFPLFDTGELSSIITDMDRGKRPQYLKDIDAEPSNIFDAPYLFVKIADAVSFSTFDTILTLLDRRTRRGHGTVFLYNSSWKYLLGCDSKDRLKGLQGDGFFGTIKVNSFWEVQNES